MISRRTCHSFTLHDSMSQRNTCHSEFLSKPQFWLEMICPVCARSICPMVRADTGGTCDASAPETGSQASAWKIEEEFFTQAQSRRCFQLRGHTLRLRRLDVLSGSRSSPATISHVAAVWRQPIAVANTFCCQTCLFMQGRALLPICTACVLNLTRQRKLLLLIVRGDEVYSVNHLGRHHAKLKRLLAGLGYD